MEKIILNYTKCIIEPFQMAQPLCALNILIFFSYNNPYQWTLIQMHSVQLDTTELLLEILFCLSPICAVPGTAASSFPKGSFRLRGSPTAKAGLALT